MAIVALTSVAGSPGVTTTAVGLTLSWPGQVLLVDADPVGGSAILTGYFRGEVEHPGTLIEMFMASRMGGLRQAIRERPVRLSDRADLIPGPAGSAQAGTLIDLWPAFAFELRHLSSLGVDVVIDLGRLGHRHFASSLMDVADEALVVVRNDLVSLGALATAPKHDREMGLAVIGESAPYSASTVAAVVGLPVRIKLPMLNKEAAVFSHGVQRPKSWWRRRTGLQRAFKISAEALSRGVDVVEEQHESAV